MIFVTVGAQMPFDRLIHAVDGWAERAGRDDVVAQIGRGGTPPRHLRWAEQYPPDGFRWFVEHASCVIAHAGMGTIITALLHGTPLLVMPRRAGLRETRSDHQIETARELAERGLLTAAADINDLDRLLERIDEMPAPPSIAEHASFELLSACRQFIEGTEPARIVPAPVRTDLPEIVPARAA